MARRKKGGIVAVAIAIGRAVGRAEKTARRAQKQAKKARKQSLQAKLIYQGVVQTSGVFDSFTLLACQVSKTDQKPDDALREYCPMFAAAAEKALGQWRYEPALKDGKPVAVYYTVSVDFKLR